MFGRKDEKPKKRRTQKDVLAQFGFMDMGLDGGGMDIDGGDDDDEDLEAELAALAAEDAPTPKPRKAKPTPMAQEDLDRLISASLKDDEDDDDESIDENDPDLLSELNELAGDNEADSAVEVQSPTQDSLAEPQSDVKSSTFETPQHGGQGGGSVVSLLEERLKMYQSAEANAKASGEMSRARRFARGVKTLSDQLRSARTGRVVNEEEIPPPVTTRVPGPASTDSASTAGTPSGLSAEGGPSTPTDIPVPSRPAPPPPVPPRQSPPAPEENSLQPQGPVGVPPAATVHADVVAKLEERRGQYRQAAVAAKKSGDKHAALQFALVVKQFDKAIAGVKEGQVADLSEMPPPPWETDIGRAPAPPEPSRSENESQQSSEVPKEPPARTAQPQTDDSPQMPTSVMEALTQRLELYQKQEAAAKTENNSGKARRMGRIVKQYQDAIKLHRAGKPIPVDDLPTPPGYPPIPVPGSAPPAPLMNVVNPAPMAPTPSAAEPRTPPASRKSADGSPGEISTAKPNVRKSPASRQEKQLALLLARQKEFKAAAVQAKARGELNQAKEYLRLAKQFDPLIDASHSGLPVDWNSVPVPPNSKVELESDFDVVTVDDCLPGSDDEIYEKLMLDLQKQYETCKTNRDHFKAMGDVASANRFENLALHTKKDYEAMKHAFRRKDPVPKFHYENKIFNIVQCCTDLTDNDLELTIVQGINYNVPNPKDVDTYVRFELPWPSAEEPQRDRTSLIKNTNNPEYGATFNLQIQRNVRACQRVFKRHSIKCEVWSRGGFLRSDTLIGTAAVKLQPLENKCILHDSFDLMEGRKAIGGKLEVKVRLRNPIVSNQVERVTEKWLVVDHV